MAALSVRWSQMVEPEANVRVVVPLETGSMQLVQRPSAAILKSRAGWSTVVTSKLPTDDQPKILITSINRCVRRCASSQA
jgi:hypothetical protein